MPSDISNKRILAAKLNVQGSLKFKEKNKEVAFLLYKQAVKTLADSTTEFELEDWRNLSIYQHNAGIACKKLNEKRWLYQGAIISLDSIFIKNFSSDDFRNKALYCFHSSLICEDPYIEIIWLEKAIENIQYISNSTSDDRRQLATYERKIGLIYLRVNNWDGAQDHFSCSLALYEKISDKHPQDDAMISVIYDELEQARLHDKTNKMLSPLIAKLADIKKTSDILEKKLTDYKSNKNNNEVIATPKATSHHHSSIFQKAVIQVPPLIINHYSLRY